MPCKAAWSLPLFVLSGCGSLPPLPPAPPPDTQLVACAEYDPPFGEQPEPVRALGTSEGFHLVEVRVGDSPWLVAAPVEPRPGEPCPVAPLDNQLAWKRTPGNFWPGFPETSVRVVRPASCSKEICPAIAIVRDRHRRSVAAAVVAPVCDFEATFERVHWFDDLDSLRVTCRQSIGAAYRESVHVLHAWKDSLRSVLSVETGVRELASAEERADPTFCELRPVGRVWLEQAGTRPKVQVVDPTRGEPGIDGAGTALQAIWQFNPTAGRFEQASEGELVPYDGRAWCEEEKGPRRRRR